MASTPVGGKPCKLTPGQTAAVRGELESVLSSPYFAGAKRCRALLDFVVHCALSGNLDDLTERTLGAELFGRPIDYETGSDAIVRVRANDVRRRLAEYCSAPHPSSQVAISLPSGSYIPEFHWSAPEVPSAPQESSAAFPSREGGETAPPGPGRVGMPGTLKRPILIAASLLVALVGVSVLLLHRSSAPDPLRAFWGPIVRGGRPVVICFGNAVAFWPSVPVRLSIESGNQALLADPGPLLETRDDTITLGDLRAAMSLQSLLSGFGVRNELRWPEEVQSTELNRQNVIFIGAFNNPWSKSLKQSLRFSFREIHSSAESIWWIQDRTSPNTRGGLHRASGRRCGSHPERVGRLLKAHCLRAYTPMRRNKADPGAPWCT